MKFSLLTSLKLPGRKASTSLKGFGSSSAVSSAFYAKIGLLVCHGWLVTYSSSNCVVLSRDGSSCVLEVIREA